MRDINQWGNRIENWICEIEKEIKSCTSLDYCQELRCGGTMTRRKELEQSTPVDIENRNDFARDRKMSMSLLLGLARSLAPSQLQGRSCQVSWNLATSSRHHPKYRTQITNNRQAMGRRHCSAISYQSTVYYDKRPELNTVPSV
ncbi:hypothetical protein MPTK1_8g05400 [Marchantia polymorpha subsp. ruderalis]|uniref:Uncharacterized protein n=1 Tax=Marchantia polymorpha TaxID=3197 RepID=A0A2R6WKD1_MARPO|nr:hypothetical protein MARPO_0081s0041 [Marchantia polymorpha]BBN18775.1 hypothetical protein Mp_8g05400 [Marchantia polymorpha subsp. ruderalis]|eukprot:PTQ34314.1 hypothetical protein MARPO_0081s0041 [Marchantia polymorpha]